MFRETIRVAGHELSRTIHAPAWKAAFAILGIWATLPRVLRAMQGGDRGSDANLGAQARALVKLYDLDVARYLSACPAAIVVMAIMTFYIVPLLTLILGFDTISADVGSGASRLLLVRASRGSFVLGKLLGRWLSFCGLVLIGDAVVSGVAMARGFDRPADVLMWGGEVYVWTSLMGASYLGLWTFISTGIRSPRTTLAWGFGVSILLGALRITFRQKVPGFAPLPGMIDELAFSGRAALQWRAACSAALWCAGTAVMASWLFNQKDV